MSDSTADAIDSEPRRAPDGTPRRAPDGTPRHAPDGTPRHAPDGTPRRAIDGNWIKMHPSCLGTHAPIEAATEVRAGGYRLDRDRIAVSVHPLARQAAHLDLVSDGLSAKFSIPYCVAHTLIHGAPGVRDFTSIDAAVRDGSRLVAVTEDRSLPEFGQC